MPSHKTVSRRREIAIFGFYGTHSEMVNRFGLLTCGDYGVGGAGVGPIDGFGVDDELGEAAG